MLPYHLPYRIPNHGAMSSLLFLQTRPSTKKKQNKKLNIQGCYSKKRTRNNGYQRKLNIHNENRSIPNMFTNYVFAKRKEIVNEKGKQKNESPELK